MRVFVAQWAGSIPSSLGPYREAQAEPGESANGRVVTLYKVKKLQKSEKLLNGRVWKFLVRKGGLEPPRFYPPDPKSDKQGPIHRMFTASQRLAVVIL